MGWYDIETAAILYDKNGKEVIREQEKYGGPFMLESMIRSNLIRKAGLSENDEAIHSYSLKFIMYSYDYQRAEKQTAHQLDPNQYLTVGEQVNFLQWTNRRTGEVIGIKGFNAVIKDSDGNTQEYDYSIVAP